MNPKYPTTVHRPHSGNIQVPNSKASQSNAHVLAKQKANIKSHYLTPKPQSSISSSRSSIPFPINPKSDMNHQSPLSLYNHSSITRQPRCHKPNMSKLKEFGESSRILGQGSTAIVMVMRKIGKNGRPDKLYAIKQFRERRDHETEKDYVEKLSDEFCIASSFAHPNIVKTFDLVLNDMKRYCTVMEYCPGGDLSKAIMAKRMTDREKFCCFKQMIQGVAYLHSMGVAHRDLKPENMLLTMEGKLKIGDFGCSHIYRFPWEYTARLSRGFVGSEPYIAPEVFAQKEYWGPSADIWSAGIAFYCILTGNMAWRRAMETDAAFCGYLCEFKRKRVFYPFQALLPNETRVINRMLNPKPDHRITALEILDDPWVKSIHVCQNNVDPSGRLHIHTNK